MELTASIANPFGAGRWTPNAKYLLSVVPRELRWVGKHEGFTAYVMPAYDPAKGQIVDPQWQSQRPRKNVVVDVPNGSGYSVLRIYDTFQVTRNLVMNVDNPSPIPVDAILIDLINNWAAAGPGANLGRGPGVIEIAAEVPTPQELQACHDRHIEYCRFLVQRGDDLDKQGRAYDIAEAERAAAEYLGVKDRPWFKGYSRAKLEKTCGACGEKILAQALTCKHCNQNLVLFYEGMGIMPNQDEDPVVYAAIKARRGANATQAPPPAAARPVQQPQPAAAASR